MAAVSAALETWDKPTLVAFSDQDPVFPLSAGARMSDRIPGAVGFHPVEGASHFLQEDKGVEISALIAAFVGD
jgi:haloalkane dehalogenase